MTSYGLIRTLTGLFLKSLYFFLRCLKRLRSFNLSWRSYGKTSESYVKTLKLRFKTDRIPAGFRDNFRRRLLVAIMTSRHYCEKSEICFRILFLTEPVVIWKYFVKIGINRFLRVLHVVVFVNKNRQRYFKIL